MAQPTDIQATILTGSTAPQSTTVDGQVMTERTSTDLIEADKHVNGAKLLKKARFGMMVRKIAPGSALG